MQINVDDSQAGSRVSLSGELCIQQVAELMTAIQAEWPAWSAIELDLAQVTDVDAAGMQCLAQIKRMALQDNKPMQIVQHSPAILEAIELLGLARHFGDPLVIAKDTGDK